MFNSNMYPILAPLRDISLQNLNDIDCGLSRSPKVKRDGVKALPIYDFLLVFNSNIWHNYSGLRNIILQNLSDFAIDIFRVLR